MDKLRLPTALGQPLGIPTQPTAPSNSSPFQVEHRPTQTGHLGLLARVLKTLGIRHILARSPQARGRSERAFGTVQDRLPQERALAGVTDYAGANDYLQKQFIPDLPVRARLR